MEKKFKKSLSEELNKLCKEDKVSDDVLKEIQTHYFRAGNSLEKINRDINNILANYPNSKSIKEGVSGSVTAEFLDFSKIDCNCFLFGDKKNKLNSSKFLNAIKEMGYFMDLRTGDLHREVGGLIYKKNISNFKTLLHEAIGFSKHTDFIRLASDSGFIDKIEKRIYPRRLNELKDNSTTQYFKFINCVVMVTKDCIEVKKYEDIPEYQVRADEVVMHYYEDKDGAKDGSLFQHDFYNFLKRICGFNDNLDDEGKINSLLKNIECLVSIIGFLLTNNIPLEKNKFIIFSDLNSRSEGGGNGGTGKTLLGRLISKLRGGMCDIDGKDDTIGINNPNKYQHYNGESIIMINDIRKNFNITSMYSIFDFGFSVKKLYKDIYKIPADEMPKFLFTSNYSLMDDSESTKRRVFEFPFYPHYNSKYTPIDEFGRAMYDDWNEDEKNIFYNFLIRSVQMYLLRGLRPLSDEYQRKIEKNRLDNLLGANMREFLEEYFEKNKAQINQTMNDNDFSLVRDIKNAYIKERDKQYKRTLEHTSKLINIFLDDRGIKLKYNHTIRYSDDECIKLNKVIHKDVFEFTKFPEGDFLKNYEN